MADSKKRKLDRMGFFDDYAMAFKNRIHTDVIVKSGDNGPGIPAHKAILAVRSKVFRCMLDYDDNIISAENSLTIPDFSCEELEALLEFFYSGTLSPANKHTRALYLAADKYDIPYLQELCRDQLVSSLSLTNVLDILELPTILTDTLLKKSAIRLVIMHMETVVNSDRYKSFVRKNPDLSLDITKAIINHFCSATSIPKVRR